MNEIPWTAISVICTWITIVISCLTAWRSARTLRQLRRFYRRPIVVIPMSIGTPYCQTGDFSPTRSTTMVTAVVKVPQ